MKTVLIDYTKFHEKDVFHPYFRDKLGVVGYFGNNLDALWDAMSHIKDDFRICVYNWEEADEGSGEEYARSVIKTLRELSEYNSHIRLDFVSIYRIY
jgi:RNAse (barnase) inhibitor barstar